ncbi:MAG: PEP/pyruvate-binding domain-containing protein [Candidatus Latescibacterota bacterium]
MPKNPMSLSLEQISPFNRDFFSSKEVMAYIGSGSIGGKASGLGFIKNTITSQLSTGSFGDISVGIPRLIVIAAYVFDCFMERNKLESASFAEMENDRIAHVFQKAEFPAEFLGDLRSIIASVQTPLAIRSSSMLEDAIYEPFAGVYATKMIPNNQPDIDVRFRKLVEAIKFVYASTYFTSARDYIQMTGHSPCDEKMAVIIQEVVGRRNNERFYPHISGVARSHNFYPMGSATQEEGIVNLALGLGKTIVDGGIVWSYSPAHPRATPPFSSPGDLLRQTQTEFWAINMGKPPEYDPIRETEYMVQCPLSCAELDGTLSFVASTYRPQDDRLVMGTGPDGPRALTFSPLLVGNEIPINDLLKELLRLCEEAVACPVEIEFALTLGPKQALPAQFGFLQVRPMVVSNAQIDITNAEMEDPRVIAASQTSLGNGIIEDITNVVYVRPEVFEAKHTPRIARELQDINRRLIAAGRPYILIGFGRWGSSDPWLGIPVEWADVSGAKVLVEATLPDMNVELSQGAHFFHNLTSFQISYLSIPHTGKYAIDWEWLSEQEVIEESAFIKHIRTKDPITIKVDGRCGRGVILR